MDESYFSDNKEDGKDMKCPPRRFPSQNPNEEWASHKPEEWISSPRSKNDPCEPRMKLHDDKKEAKVIAQEHEAVAIDEAILFDEKEEIKEGADGRVLASYPNKLLVSNEDRNTAHGTLGGPQMVSALRRPDYSLGAEAVDIQGWHCPHETEEGRTQKLMPPVPGAFREGGLDIEEGYEEDEFTVTIQEGDEEQTPVVTRERSIDPISAELVNAEEEEMRLQEKINQALQRERQQAVVAEVAPQSDGHRFGTTRRKWFVTGAILLIVVTVTTALVLTLPSSRPSTHPSMLPNVTVTFPEYIGDGACDGEPYNTEECGWDGGDCVHCNATYFGPNCTLHYPNCFVPVPDFIGDGVCDGEPYNTTECGWDGGDCCLPGYFGLTCTLHYPNCSVPFPD